MQLVIHNIADPNKEAIVRAAMTYYGKMLLPILHKKITVNVYWNYDLPKEFEAETEWTDKNVFPKVFDIKLSKSIKNLRKIIQTLAHEMVHVKQFAKGEIYDHKFRRTFKWGKQVFNVDTCDYWDLPWEIEAYGKEVGLYVRFKEFFDVSNREIERDHELAARVILSKEQKLLAFNPQSDRIRKKRKGDCNAVVCGNDAETSLRGGTPLCQNDDQQSNPA